MAILAALALLTARAAWGGPATDTLRAFFDEASRIVAAPDPDRGLADRRNAVRALAERVFDFRGAAATALGPAWEARTSAERTEFARLFAELVESGYLTLVGSKARVTGGVSVRFLGESVDGAAATVRTSLLTRSGDDLPVDYRMLRLGERWAVRDVVIDGVSLVENYQAQLHRVLQGSSYDDLVAALRARVPEPSRALAAVAAAPVTDAPAVAPRPHAAPAGPAAAPEAAAPLAGTPRAPAPPARVAEAPVSAPRPAAGPPAPVAERPAPVPERPAAVAGRPAARAEGAAVSARPVRRPERAAVAPAPRAWWVQVGAFRNAQAASRLLERLERERAVAVFDGAAAAPLARVLVGPFAERARATAKLRELVASGYPAFLTPGR